MRLDPATSKWTQIVSFGAALLALVLWGQVEAPRLLTAALLCAGPGFIMASIESLLARRVRLLEWIEQETQTWNTAAILWGFTFLLLGITCLYAGVIRSLGLNPAFLAYLQNRPGLSMILFGLAIGSTGLATMIGPVEWRTGWRQILQHFPYRATGLLMFSVGFVATSLGLFETIAPAQFDQWIEAALGPFNPFP